MTIPRVWSNGVASMPITAQSQPMLASADSASLDANTQRALDKSVSGATVYGTLTLGAGGRVSLDSPTSKVVVSGSATTSTGGRVVCGNSDFPVFSSTVNSIVYTTFGEMFSNLSGGTSVFWPLPAGVSPNWPWYVDPNGSIYCGTNITKEVSGGSILPITRIHDNATFIEFAVLFIVNAGRTVLPDRFPAANFLQYDPFLNITTSLTGWVYFPSPGTGSAGLVAYKNGGAPNQVTLFPSGSVNLSKYLYFVALLDEDYAGEVIAGTPNEYVGLFSAVQTHSMVFQ